LLKGASANLLGTFFKKLVYAQPKGAYKDQKEQPYPAKILKA